MVCSLDRPVCRCGLVEIIENLPIAMNNPFHITVCEDSVKTVLLFLLAYGWGSVSIFPHERITAGVRNTVLQNGAMQEP